MIAGLESAILGAGNDVAHLLDANLPGLFESFPDASLWLVSTDSVLLARLAFLRVRYALELTPDVHLNADEYESLRALSGHSLTQGVEFSDLIKPLLLTFSPGAIGYAFPWPPHTLVLLFGSSIELRQPDPPSLASLYAPSLMNLDDPDAWIDPEFWRDEFSPGDLEILLAWWVSRLNLVYAHAANPAGFAGNGLHNVAQQFAWLLTVERLVLDAICILSGVQSPWPTQQAAAFDLLDKAEALLGYGSEASGDGFKRLLQRSEMRSRLDRAWEMLPVRLRTRFQKHSQKLYEHLYSYVHDHSMAHRRTRGAVKVWDERARRYVGSPLDSYVPNIVREVRNSSHGFLEQIEGNKRHVIATHDAHLPRSLANLAALIFFALIADPERTIAGTFWSQ